MPKVELRAGTIQYQDTGGDGPVVVLLHGLAMDGSLHPERIARLVITSCEAFDNFPPGLPGRAVSLAGRLPGGLNAMVQPLRVRALRRLPTVWGWMAKRPIPDAVTDAWLRPMLTQPQIRRDLAKYLRGAAKDPGVMVAAAEGLRGFDRPALVVWAAEDRVMPPVHGRRLAELLPHAQLLEVADSYTLIPEDQPAQARSSMAAIKQASNQALGELRSVLEILRQQDQPASRSTATFARLDALVAQARAAGLEVRTQIQGQVRLLPSNVDAAAFRIVQEALTNVTRHAGPTTATVHVTYGDQDLSVEVDDDHGPGVRNRADGGMGLLGMRERVAALDGELQAGPRPGGGFRVRARLPLDGSRRSRQEAVMEDGC